MDRLDERIDEVAHDMTGGDPGPSIRARVLARIGEEARQPRALRPSWVVLSTSIAAAAIALAAAVLAPRPPSPAIRHTPTSTTTEGHQPAAPASDSRLQETPAAQSAQSADSIALRAAAARSRAPDSIRDPAGLFPSELQPLASSSIGFDPLGVECMDALEPIEAPELALTPLDVGALTAE